MFRNSESFQYVDEMGYYYFIENNDSITNTRYNPQKCNGIIYSIFSNIKFLYEKTDNSFLDKYLSIYKLEQGYYRYEYCFKYLNNNFDLIKSILNKLLNSNYISLKKKIIISNIKKEIFNESLINE